MAYPMNGPPGLDRFAPSYIPVWQRSNPPEEQVVLLPPFSSISPYQYADVLFPLPLLRNLDAHDETNMQACANQWAATLRSLPQDLSSLPSSNGTPHTEASVIRSRKLPPLTPANYVTRSTLLQDSEYHARLAALRASTLYSVMLTPVVNIPQHSPSDAALYTLEAPHIRESYPPVSIFDTIWLRQLRPWSSSLQGLVFDARIHSIQRTKGSIVLQCDALSAPGMWESGMFNVEFAPQSRHFALCRKALESMHADITEHDPDQFIRKFPSRWLFPNPGDCVASLPSQPLPPMKWVDPNLNEEQELAVESIVHGKHGIPYLISGPPGTGKTKTIVEAVLQIIAHHPNTHVLVCGASNSSADTLASRLSRQLGPDELFRLNDPSRSLDEVRVALHAWCYSFNGVWALPPIKDLLAKKVIVTTCLDASILSTVRCSNSALSVLEEHVFSHLYASSFSITSSHTKQHFGFLLVDEAAQASEMELAVPLAVVAPAPHFYTASPSPTPSDFPHVTICGDVKQLGPRIESADCRSSDMDVSLLERLFAREVYHLSPYSRRATRLRKVGATREVVEPQDIRTPFCNLVKNYRSHPAILMQPSTLFYEDTLLAFAPKEIQTSPLRHWPALRTPDFPVLFLGTDSTPEEWTDERLSFYNSGELNVIAEVITGLLGRGESSSQYFLPEEFRGRLAANEISVISPFREQVWKVRQGLRRIGLGAVDVGDVESLQGAENRVVIISTVRSSPRFLEDDQRLNRGIIFEAKRFNVALTRAKELLIIVGNPEILRTDPWWKQLLTFLIRNNAYTGPAIPSIDPSSVVGLSRLEEEWILRHPEVRNKRRVSGSSVASPTTPDFENDDDDGETGEYDSGFMIAGSLVRDALQDDG